MNYSKPKLIQISGFIVTGLNIRTSNEKEFNQDTAQLPQLWNKFLSSGIIEKISNQIPDTPVYGVYSDYESDASGFYTVTAGVSVRSPYSDELSTVSIQSGQYLVFSDKGAMLQIVTGIWERIWNYFQENTVYKRRFISDFEVYSQADEIAVYVGIDTEL